MRLVRTLVVIACAAVSVALPAVAARASAENYVLDLVSGPDAHPCPPGTPSYCAVQSFDDATPDGRHVLFTTAAQLSPGDNDALVDLYDWNDGSFTALGETTSFPKISDDGMGIVFGTTRALVPGDTDGGYSDIYLTQNGVVTPISVPSGGSSVPENAGRPEISPDADRVSFTSAEPLVPEDLDDKNDGYEWSGGVIRLVTTGPLDPGAQGTDEYYAPYFSGDGGRVFFTTNTRYLPEDQSYTDIYERVNGQTILLTTGPHEANDGQVGLYQERFSRDGSRLAFVTGEGLVPEDTDGRIDLYLRENGTTTLLSQPGPNPGVYRSYLKWISDDGSRVFFTTNDRYSPQDTNTGYDLYEWRDGQITLLSIGQNGAAGDIYEGQPVAFSDDGLHAYFDSSEALTADDQNDRWYDVYERSGGVTRLLSVGAGAGTPCCSDQGGLFPIPDGSGLIYRTTYRLVPEDQNGTHGDDIYKLTPAGATLLSTGPSGQGAWFVDSVSDDGSRIFFTTPLTLVPHDPHPRIDGYTGGNDIYLARRATTIGYGRPKGASPTYVSLVPAYAPCTAPNRSHGAPLSFGSCAPPAATSSQLTIGTPDANGRGASSIGWANVKALSGNPATPADEADLRFELSLSDVRKRSDLSDYTGELAPRVGVRLTDRDAGIPSTLEFPFSYAVPCSATGSTAVGSTCALTTTADSVTPGLIRESQRTVWALDRLEVYDGGADGDADTGGDNTLFATQGIFVP